MVYLNTNHVIKDGAERLISLVVLTAYLLLLHLPYQGLKKGK
jgi:hypothetical protein